MNIRLAGAEDIDTLVAMRLALPAALGSGRFFMALAEQDGLPFGAAFMEVQARLPQPDALNGRVGYITNVYMAPAHRRRGAAKAMLQLLIDTGRAAGLGKFSLLATDAGQPVYTGLGFKPDDAVPMRLSFEENRTEDRR